MAGTGWSTFGSHGSGINQFLFPWGVSVTPTGQIFVADVYRIVRINDMAGGGWTTFGSSGSGINQFLGLAGIFVGPTGQIFVADMGNDRIVRINDMTGTDWTAFGPQGSGTNRFERPRGIFVNPAGQIYLLAATGVVRIDDMAGTGWTNPMMAGPSEQRWYWAASSFISPTGRIFGSDYRDNSIFSRPFDLPPSTPPLPPPSAGSPAPGDRPHGTPGEQKITLYRDIDPAWGQDEAATYEGALGDFSVTRDQAADYPPCPQPSRLAQNYKTSELYTPLFGEHLEVYECANGMIPIIEMDYGGPGKRYFVGPAKVPFVAPLWRLKLLTVSGKPAIAQLPVRGISDRLRIAVIERFPGGDRPGILVFIDSSTGSLEETAAVAARMIGVRP
jgi:hypothetical protein